MKRRFEKLAGLALAGVMAFSTAVPAFAADTSLADITVNGKGGAFAAYRLLDLTTSLKSDDAAHEGHEDGQHGPDCYNYSYTLNDKYDAAVRSALDLGADATQADVISKFEGMADKGDEIRAFADKIFGLIKDMAADETANNKVFADVQQGYYLIVETATEDDKDAISLVMLDTAGQDDVSVTTKEDVPKVTKKIKDSDDTTGEKSDWQDAGDFDVGDDVDFQLTGTLPANIAAFDTYKYVFHDTLQAGLTLKADSIVVKAGDKILNDTNYQVKTDAEDCTFEVEVLGIMDMVKSGALTADSVITVEYQATLNSDAQTGLPGNENTVYLEFSRNPYNGGEGTSKTPEDTVIGFTYKLQVNKVDGQQNPLAGAEFKLMKMDSTGEYVDYPNGNIEITADQTEFNFKGLDAGKYKLVETKVPSGYNKAEDVEFEVVAQYDTEADQPELKSLQVMQDGKLVSGEAGSGEAFEIAMSDGNIVTAVVNSTGVHLPTTGGAGAYLVYGLGAFAVIGGAGLVLVNKKRKSSSDAER